MWSPGEADIRMEEGDPETRGAHSLGDHVEAITAWGRWGAGTRLAIGNVNN